MERDGELEARAAVGREEIEAAAHAFGEVAADGEAEAGAARAFINAGTRALEGKENTVTCFPGNARAIVVDNRKVSTILTTSSMACVRITPTPARRAILVAAAAALAAPALHAQEVQAKVERAGEKIVVDVKARVAAPLATTWGVLVDYEGAEDAGKDVAMHISFAKPAYMTKAEVPADVVERERGILAARAAESGKPAEIVAKMVEGGLNKFLGEQSLLGQPFIKDDKQTVEKMLAAKKTKLVAYRFLVVGEGIEKKASDFAAEVMSMVKN